MALFRRGTVLAFPVFHAARNDPAPEPAPKPQQPASRGLGQAPSRSSGLLSPKHCA